MPRVQLSNPRRGINECKAFATPTIADTSKWWREARKVIPQIPDVDSTDWFIAHETVTEGSIIWELRNSIGEKCAVVVDRKFDMVAGK
jgi:hypothetical protein